VKWPCLWTNVESLGVFSACVESLGAFSSALCLSAARYRSQAS